MRNDATMSEKSKPAKAGNNLMPDFGSWMEGGVRAWESWAQSNGSMMKGCSELAQEMLAFSQTRFRTDMDTWKALTACRNADELFERQKEFTEKATAQYLDEVNKLATKMIGVMSGATASFREQAAKP